MLKICENCGAITSNIYGCKCGCNERMYVKNYSEQKFRIKFK